MALERDRIPETLLFELFDCAFGVEPRDEAYWRPAASPAPEHVGAIEADLGIRLPSLLVELATRCRYFGRWFGDLGPGITHSSGKSIAFSRDPEGRITKITDRSTQRPLRGNHR